MACRYTYQGVTYSASEFIRLLSGLPPHEATTFMPSVKTVPPAPFVGKTEAWAMLAMKRMIRYAAENGFDRIAWTPGAVQAERYDLSKQVESILVNTGTDGQRTVSIEMVGRQEYDPWMDLTVDRDGKVLAASSSLGEATGKTLDDVIGKEMAERVMVVEGSKLFQGEGLHVGGEGMKGFYDKILPAEVGKYVKKWGAKVGRADVAGVQAHAVEITPAMRASVLEEGQPLWSRRDAYGKAALDALRTVARAGRGGLSKFHHPELGEIAVDYGEPGNPEKGYRGGSGVSHILARRMAEGASLQDAADTVAHAILAAAEGAIAREYGPGKTRVDVEMNGYTAVLSKQRFGREETWVVTGFKNDADAQEQATRLARGYAPVDFGSR